MIHHETPYDFLHEKIFFQCFLWHCTTRQQKSNNSECSTVQDWTFLSIFLSFFTEYLLFSHLCCPPRRQHMVLCHPRWQPTYGLPSLPWAGEELDWARDYCIVVRCTTIEPPFLHTRLDYVQLHQTSHKASNFNEQSIKKFFEVIWVYK